MISTTAETTRVIRRHERDARLLAEDLTDEADRLREARVEGWNAALELAASLMKLRGAREDAALIRRQMKEVI